MKTLIYHYTPLSKHLIADLFDIYIFTSGILYLILLLTSYTHVIFILLANNLTHSSTWNYICTCITPLIISAWTKITSRFFQARCRIFFFLSVYTCLYIHVYIYIFVLFLEKKNEKKNCKCWKHKMIKKNLAAVIYFLLPDPDDVCLISAGNSELSKTSSY